MNAILLGFLLSAMPQAASVACAEPVADRGRVRGGPALEHSFTIQIRGSSTVTITEIRGSCGCFSPQISNRVLTPGMHARLDVAVSTVTQPDGPNAWKIQVKYRTGGEDDQELELLLKATLVREVRLTPAAVQLIGAPGAQHEVVLLDRRAKPLKIDAVQSSSDRLRVAAGTWEKAMEGWKCRLQVRLASDCPAGTWDEAVQIVGDEPGYRELRLPVRIVCRGTQRVQVSPDMVQLRHVPGKPAASVLVLLRDAQGQPVEVAAVECADTALTARFADGEHATAAVRLSIAAGKTPQPRSTVKIQIRKPVAETLTVPVEVGR